MEVRPRIAVVATRGSDLPARVVALAQGPLVQAFGDLYDDADAMRRFHPSVLLLERDDLTEADLGALRVLRSLLPDLAVVVATAAANEARLKPRLEDLDGTVLPMPASQGELATCLHQARSGPRGTEMLLDLVRGLSDEINNPLQMVSGHLRLLEDALDSGAPTTAQLALVREGLGRVEATLAKLRTVVHAAEDRLPQDTVALAPLAEDAARRIGQASGRALAVLIEGGAEQWTVRGDEDLLRTMVDELARTSIALADAGGDAHLEVGREDDRVRLRVQVDAEGLPPWRLPRTYEPYYLQRLLRGSAQGLGLFVVQVIARAHGGIALARWIDEGTLALEVLLPRGG